MISDIDRDLVSPAHPVSNLRLLTFAVPKNESKVEKEYRMKRKELQDWNQDYWLKNNQAFQKVFII
jgi:hypothetical protein